MTTVLRTLTYCFLALLVGMHAHAASPLDGVQVRQILVSRSALPIDVSAPDAHTPMGFYVLDGLIAAALVENKVKRQREVWRQDIADLRGDPRVVAWMDQFQGDLGAVLKTHFGSSDAVVETFATHEQRHSREVQLAPVAVLSALIFNEIRPQRHCGALGFAVNHGSAHLKKSKDIKRRPFEIYVPKPERTQVMLSEWCRPGSEQSYRSIKVGEQRIASADELIAVLDKRKQELLAALASPPTGDIDPKRVATIAPRERPFYVVAYGKQRSWIATTDHQLLRLVPNLNLEEIRCSNACGAIQRAQAQERARRSTWERENGKLLVE